MKNLPFLILTLTAVAVLTACSAPHPPRERYFWPPGSATPRVEYLDFLQSDHDLTGGAESALETAVFGKEEPRLLFKRPQQVASDGRRLLVSDPGQTDVLLLDLETHTVRSLAQINSEELTFQFPYGVALDEGGSMYVSDSKTALIYRFGPDGKLLSAFGQGEMTRPTSLTVDSRHGRIYVVDTGAHRLLVFDLSGTLLKQIGSRGAGPGEFNFPLDVDIGPDGNLYVLDSVNARVQVLAPDGTFLRAFGERGTAIGSFMLPKGIAVSPSGHVYVTDSQANRFIIFDSEGQVLLTIGGRYAVQGGRVAPGGLYLPQGIEIDPQESIWVVDSLNRMVHRFQYLNERYLSEHPIRPGEGVLPVEGDEG